MLKSIFDHFFRSHKRHDPIPIPSRIEELRQRFPDALEWQREVIRDVEDWTMTSPERVHALCEAVRYLVTNQIEGAIVECGVWRGGSMAAIAKSLLQLDVEDRELWLYDTFDGMSEPTTVDVDFLGRDAQALMNAEVETGVDPEARESVWCQSPLESVKKRMTSTGYPEHRARFVKGMVEDTLPVETPEQIALLRLDTDWYESTKVELEYLFPKLVPGGVFIVDDYGHWDGCRRAVDEYFENNGIKMMLNRIDYTGRIGIFAPSEIFEANLNDMEAAA